MKSPINLIQKLKRQWESADNRESRLLGVAGAWPIVLSIGRPSPKQLTEDFDTVRRHVQQWRDVSVGEVVWESVNFRATADPVQLPVTWRIHQPTEWIRACADRVIREEFEMLTALVEQADHLFHALLIRRRSLWRNKPPAEVVQATRLAMKLGPGCADGRPLRLLSLAGIDTKFFERHSGLVTALLDVRYDGEVSRIGLENFLGAINEGEHWLLVVDLDGALLPFRAQRVRSTELKQTQLPGCRLLIVENETCQHQLPDLPDTIAVLGSGFDLGWTEGSWLAEKKVGYWGDIDTWGLHFLAKARQSVSQLDVLLMTAEVFRKHQGNAVAEPVVAGTEPPVDLTPEEQLFYQQLLTKTCGRLEQEFLVEALVHKTLRAWAE